MNECVCVCERGSNISGIHLSTHSFFSISTGYKARYDLGASHVLKGLFTGEPDQPVKRSDMPCGPLGQNNVFHACGESTGCMVL